jgi:hypothetical protein
VIDAQCMIVADSLIVTDSMIDGDSLIYAVCMIDGGYSGGRVTPNPMRASRTSTAPGRSRSLTFAALNT